MAHLFLCQKWDYKPLKVWKDGVKRGEIMKSKYETFVEPKLELIECWCRDGLTEEQISKNLGIAYSTFRKYKSKHVALSAVLTRGKEVVDYEVESALLKRTKGYTVQLRKPFKLKKIEYDENGKKLREREEIEYAIEEEHIPADVKAQIFWLSLRQRRKWCEKIAVAEELGNSEIDGETGVVMLPEVIDTPSEISEEDGDENEK